MSLSWEGVSKALQRSTRKELKNGSGENKLRIICCKVVTE